MHGKNLENIKGTDISIFKYIDEPITYEQFGFEILFEENIDENTMHNEDESSFQEGKSTKRFVEDFTDDAIIYRSILNYYVEHEITTFFRSGFLIENWLLENCQYFENKYPGSLKKTNIPNKIKQNNSKVVYLLERLKYLSILESRSVETKNHLSTTEYKFTELGKLCALLLKFSDNSFNDLLVDKIYKQILNYYEQQDYSLAAFCKLFLTNCYKEDKMIFKVFVIPRLLQIIKENPNDVISVLNKLRNFQLFYKNKTLLKILISSLNEYNSIYPIGFQKILYKLKFNIELLQEKYCKNLKSFEDLRFKNNGLYSVVIEGYCSICNNYTPCIAENMTEFFKSLIIDAKRGGVKTDCPNCKSQQSLHFELLS